MKPAEGATSSRGQALRFGIAGTVGLLAYYLALYGLTEYLGVWYLASATVGFLLNTGLSFTLLKFWAFEQTDLKTVHRQMVQYLLMNVAFLVANLLFLYCLVSYWHLWYLGAQLALSAVFAILGFLISRRIFAQDKT